MARRAIADTLTELLYQANVPVSGRHRPDADNRRAIFDCVIVMKRTVVITIISLLYLVYLYCRTVCFKIMIMFAHIDKSRV